MKFLETSLPGAFIIDIEPHVDARGFFARAFCADEFRAHGLDPVFMQCSLSQNREQGTLRGLHFQWAPWGEVKLVRCVQGAILDVILDVRPESPTFGKHEAVELSARNYRSLYIPKGFAHGFQTLADDSLVYYQMAQPYVPSAAGGIRASDPALGIAWPLPVSQISDKDLQLPDFATLSARFKSSATTTH